MNMKLTAVSKRRLATLIKFMRALPKEANKHFYMGCWVGGAGNADAELTPKKLYECGTTACAAGWGTTIPSLKKEGFRYNSAHGFSASPEIFFGVEDRYLRTPGGLVDMESVLFMNGAKTPKGWARMAETAIRRYEKQMAAA